MIVCKFRQFRQYVMCLMHGGDFSYEDKDLFYARFENLHIIMTHINTAHAQKQHKLLAFKRTRQSLRADHTSDDGRRDSKNGSNQAKNSNRRMNESSLAIITTLHAYVNQSIKSIIARCMHDHLLFFAVLELLGANVCKLERR